MTISVIIPTYNRNDDLKECLKSIRENSRYENEIIVLHPFCDEDIMHICNEYSAKLVPDGSRENGKRVKSLWAIINSGIEIAENQHVCWLNDDCVVLKDWDFYALEYFKKDKDVALVVLKTKGIGNRPSFEVLKLSFNIPCANYGVLDKFQNIRFDESYSWFQGDADISMRTAIKYCKKVVPTDENCVVHSHKIDANRNQNETDKRSTIDKKRYNKKWDVYKMSKKGEIVKKSIPLRSYHLIRKIIRLILFGRKM